jgi:hypothetical protein
MWASGHNGDIARGVRLRGHARSRDGGVRKELAAAVTLRHQPDRDDVRLRTIA